MLRSNHPNAQNASPSLPQGAQSTQVREPHTFGRRKEPHLVTITRNGKSSEFAINPIFFSLAACVVVMFSVGYLAATTYLVLRDDLMSAKAARSAQIIHEYEDRIAALRTNLDKVTSRQLLDQKAIENRIEALLARQQQLAGGDDSFTRILDKAGKMGLKAQSVDTITTGAVAAPKLDKQAKADSASLFAFRGTQANPKFQIADIVPMQARTPNEYQTAKLISGSLPVEKETQRAVFAAVENSIQTIDLKRKSAVETLRSQAMSQGSKLASLLKKAGARLPKSAPKQVGGPFVPMDQSLDLETHVHALEATLNSLEILKHTSHTLPLANPVPGKPISSRFGPRVDPFKGKYAMHSGMDFKAKTGTPVRATGNGRVVFASRKGGYGKLVEIQHANGLVTRYGHLSRISVNVGQKVKTGTQIGKVGSTGRSTGPHLHYEVRRAKKALNPNAYLQIGKKIDRLIKS